LRPIISAEDLHDLWFWMKQSGACLCVILWVRSHLVVLISSMLDVGIVLVLIALVRNLSRMACVVTMHDIDRPICRIVAEWWTVNRLRTIGGSSLFFSGGT
jgi:hypothetical protein